LTAAGYGVDFVGSVTDNPGSLPPNAINQEGHCGYMITSGTTADGVARGGIADNIGTWLGPNGSDPSIILLMIGTNDIAGGYETSTAPDRLSGLISMISNRTTGLKPNAQLIVAEIVPTENTSTNAQIEIYNAGVASVVAGHRALGENVSLVDMYSALNYSTDISSDGIHPNLSGYNKMAEVWFGGIQAAISTPEPGSLAIFCSGVLASCAYIRRHRLRRCKASRP
jgi:lysophospholipase L1-like esterase